MAYHRLWHDTSTDNTQEYLDIFSEYDFERADDCCDFFCPDCKKMPECVAYEEIKGGWDSFYM